jgi:transcription-repair coupling factor (superfamily II helicase)
VGRYPLPDLRSLAGELNRGAADLALGGVVPAARSLALAALAEAGWIPRPCLVVVPHLADSSELAAGLALLAPRLAVGAAPAELATPYLGSEPPLAARLQLVRLLDDLAHERLDIVAVPARALLQPVPEPAAVARQTLQLGRGDRLDPTLLAERLTAAGYRRVDLVEEAGEFAPRGWIVDLHPGGERALRVELDDDVIEQIRPFDPSSQRTCGEPVDRALLPPLDPFPATDDRRLRVAALLESDLPALAAHLVSGSERRLWWSALHLTDPSSSWLDLASSVVVCDRDEVLGELGRWLKVQEREWQALERRHLALPPPSRLLVELERVRPAVVAPHLRIEQLEVVDGVTRWWRVPTVPSDSFARRIPDLVPTLRQRRAEDLAQVLVVASEGEERRFTHLLSQGEVEPLPAPPPPGAVSVVRGDLQLGFVWQGHLAVYGRRNLTAAPAPRPRRVGLAAFTSDLRDLKPGDLVVHSDHGFGRFSGFRRVGVEGRTLEMMVLDYRGGDSLLVPVERADLIQKYAAGDSEHAPQLDRLGGSTWRRRKARVKKAVREMAAELLRLQAARRASRGHPF